MGLIILSTTHLETSISLHRIVLYFVHKEVHFDLKGHIVTTLSGGRSNFIVKQINTQKPLRYSLSVVVNGCSKEASKNK